MHLAATVERFNQLLRQSRTGDLTSPFAPDELADVNERAVDGFEGEPLVRLGEEVEQFLRALDNAEELIAHQRGPIPVGLQLRFLLNELAIHHDDVSAALGRRYRPSAEVIEALVPVWQVLGSLPGSGDGWEEILSASGR